MSIHIHTITKDDVGKTEKDHPMFEPLGRVIKRDIGKRIYRGGSYGGTIYQVENNEQRRKRLRERVVGETQKKVLVALRPNHPRTTNQIAHQTGLSKHAVGNALRRLRTRKLVQIIGATTAGENIYQITARGCEIVSPS